MSKLATLSLLYFAQGLPFGFQATALPLLLRERGVSLATVGFSSLLAAPWLAKALWAPLVDRFGNRQFGRRKSWIVPMQLALALLCLLAAGTQDLRLLAGLVLAMNFCAATQDIAVDGLAISWIEPEQLGPVNAIQVVGYKLGMLTGGGLLVWASGLIGWSGLFHAMAGLMLAVMLVSVTMREAEADTQPLPALPFAELGARLKSALASPETLGLVLVVTTYKTGEALADGMWKPLLLDRGFSVPQIGRWAGSFGLLASLIGSASGGLLARQLSLPRALLYVAGLRAFGVAGEWWISCLQQPSASSVIAVTCFEHLVGGAITTVLFALMMRHTDREIGATHYTLLASLEVWGKLPLSALSGVIAERFGYQTLFATATALCVAFALLATALQRKLSV